MSVHHIAERWARTIWAAVQAESDPRTLDDWAHASATSVSTLRSWSYLAGVPPGRSLRLARLLRAVARASAENEEPESLLDVSDPRTLRRLLVSAGLAQREMPSDVPVFLSAQTLVTAPLLLAAIRRLGPDGQ
jgi:hypothetical protein